MKKILDKKCKSYEKCNLRQDDGGCCFSGECPWCEIIYGDDIEVIEFGSDELEEIKFMTANLIEEIYDDPIACCDNEEKEVVSRLSVLNRICLKIGLDYNEVVNRRSEEEKDRVAEIIINVLREKFGNK